MTMLAAATLSDSLHLILNGHVAAVAQGLFGGFCFYFHVVINLLNFKILFNVFSNAEMILMCMFL